MRLCKMFDFTKWDITDKNNWDIEQIVTLPRFTGLPLFLLAKVLQLLSYPICKIGEGWLVPEHLVKRIGGEEENDGTRENS